MEDRLHNSHFAGSMQLPGLFGRAWADSSSDAEEDLIAEAEPPLRPEIENFAVLEEAVHIVEAVVLLQVDTDLDFAVDSCLDCCAASALEEELPSLAAALQEEAGRIVAVEERPALERLVAGSCPQEAGNSSAAFARISASTSTGDQKKARTM